jgi:hypothetical protein
MVRVATTLQLDWKLSPVALGLSHVGAKGVDFRKDSLPGTTLGIDWSLACETLMERQNGQIDTRPSLHLDIYSHQSRNVAFTHAFVEAVSTCWNKASKLFDIDGLAVVLGQGCSDGLAHLDRCQTIPA